MVLITSTVLAMSMLLLAALPVFGQSKPDDEPPASPPSSAPVTPPEGLNDGDSVGYDGSTEVEDVGADQPGSVEIVRARLVGEFGHGAVKSIRRVADDVGRFEWSRQGDRIAFDKPGERGHRALYTMGLEAGLERCLTCENYELRGRNVISPTWHPSGKVLVALAQDHARRLKMDTVELATAKRSYHSDLWAVTADGRDAWQLTRISDNGGAVLDPQFSFEGDRLAWSERVDSSVGGWGHWVVRVAEFTNKRGLPRLKSTTKHAVMSWPGVVMVHGFTEDDRGLWLTVTPNPAQRPTGGLTPARYDLTTGELDVIEAGGLWDELPSPVPRGDRIVFASDRGLRPTAERRLPRRHDLWLRSAIGRHQERLTYFNDPQAADSLGEAWIADTSWSPDGDRLLLQVLVPSAAGSEVAADEALYVIEIDPESLR